MGGDKMTAKELQEKLEEMGYKNFKIISAIKIEDGIYEADMEVRGRKVRNKIDLYASDNKFKSL